MLVHLEAMIINDILIASMSVFIRHNQYHRLPPLLDTSKYLTEENKLFHKRPIVEMVEGKFDLFSQKDSQKAKRKYLNGANIAKYLDDDHLSHQIMQEWESDLKIFTDSQL